MNGVIVINKEKGYTSFDVVQVVRRILGVKKAGHTGTLDPNATGVLPVLLGTATKAQDIIPNHDKAYRAAFRLGIATDTLDIWGTVQQEEHTHLSAQEIERALSRFRGKIEQLPPMYSAVSVDGKRLYQYAREGVTVERRTRTVTVYALTLLRFDEQRQEGELSIACSRGTYVRTLIDDLARSLGTVGVMTDLERTAACGYTLADAVTLSTLGDIAAAGTLELRDVESLFQSFPELVVSDAQAHRFRNGNPLSLDRTALKHHADDGAVYRVKDSGGQFLSLGIVDMDAGELKMYKHF